MVCVCQFYTKLISFYIYIIYIHIDRAFKKKLLFIFKQFINHYRLLNFLLSLSLNLGIAFKYKDLSMFDYGNIPYFEPLAEFYPFPPHYNFAFLYHYQCIVAGMVCSILSLRHLHIFYIVSVYKKCMGGGMYNAANV